MTGDCPFCHQLVDYGSAFGSLDEDDMECIPKMQRACHGCVAERVDQILELMIHHDDLDHHLTHHTKDVPEYYRHLVEGMKRILGS